MRKVYTTHGNPFVTRHKASTDRSVPFGRSEGPDGYVTSPGSPFVDVWGEEGGVFVANDTDLGSIIYETTAGFEEADKHISEVMGRSWKSSDDTLAVSWEVDAKTLYVAGTGYDVSAQIAGDIFACALQSEASAVIVHRLDADDYAVTTLALSNGENGSFVRSVFPITIADPVLFMGFGGTAGSFFTVTTPDTGSVVARWTYDAPVWTSQTLTVLNPLNVTESITYDKDLDNGFVSSVGVIGGEGAFDIMHVKGNNMQNEVVTISGERIVAVSTDGDTLALLLQDYTSRYERQVNKPEYSMVENISIIIYPMIVLSWVVRYLYSWHISYTAYDSGKLQDYDHTESSSSFSRMTIRSARDGTVINREANALPSGQYSATNDIYTREASPMFSQTEIDSFNVPPYSAIWASRNIYHEHGYLHDRTFNSAIKIYCADPARNVYVYQRFIGTSHDFSLFYDEPKIWGHPSEEDIARVAQEYTGTIETVLRANGVDHVLHSRPYELEVGVVVANRYDLNFEPTMPYYTQYQGPLRNSSVDNHGSYSSSGEKTINKSVNLAFKGRYVDSDSQKTLVSYGFNVNAENDITPSLNFREFEDINKLKYNRTWTEGYQPKSWQLIKGWGDFARRGGFKIVDVNGSVFVSPAVTQHSFKTLPVSLRMVS